MELNLRFPDQQCSPIHNTDGQRGGVEVNKDISRSVVVSEWWGGIRRGEEEEEEGQCGEERESQMEGVGRWICFWYLIKVKTCLVRPRTLPLFTFSHSDLW